MADAFKGVVMLLVAAGVFAQGLMSIGAIDNFKQLLSTATLSLVLIIVALILYRKYAHDYIMERSGLRQLFSAYNSGKNNNK